MSQPPLNNSGASYWNDLVEEFDSSPDEKREIREGADHMIAEVRARRLAEVRKRQKATQVEVAAAMDVSQARVSRIVPPRPHRFCKSSKVPGNPGYLRHFLSEPPALLALV
jgi:predicted XRE-type DNA-binding protein